MTQLLDSVELSITPDSFGKTHHWLGPVITEPSGQVVRRVYQSGVDPLTLSEREIAELQPIATIIITSPQDKAQYPDAPDYMTHISDPGSRQERQKLREIIADLDPLSGSLPQPRNS